METYSISRISEVSPISPTFKFLRSQVLSKLLYGRIMETLLSILRIQMEGQEEEEEEKEEEEDRVIK
jgi:hypothetical protein